MHRSNRLRERDRWVAWLAEAAQQAPWTEAAAEAERQAARSLFTQGQGAEAIQRLEALIERLSRTTEFDPSFELAATRLQLGRTYTAAGETRRAIPILRDNVRAWEGLCEQRGVGALAHGTPASNASEATTTEPPPVGSPQAAVLGNLSTALGDLANALRDAGHLDEALAAAERGIAVSVVLRRDRDVAAGLGQVAGILSLQGNYAEADARYDRALDAARRCGDGELEATLLQNQGSLADDMRRYDRSTELCTQALKLFQAAGDEANVMHTCNLLGVVDLKQGRLAEARAWYERSREIALQRRDKLALAAAAQNLGIVCQQEGAQAAARGDTTAARERFTEAAKFVEQSLALKTERGDEPGQARSHDQLGRIYRLAGDLARAEAHAQRARQIREALNDLRGLSITYQTLRYIARARGDEPQAAEWEAKETTVDAELAHRARGGDGPPTQVLDALAALAVACVQSAAGGSSLPSGAQQALEKLDSPEAGVLQPLGAWLRRLATTPPAQLGAALATPPAGLPPRLAQVIAQLREAVEQTGPHAG